MKGLIFDIKRYSINDGNGIRTTVFFKGCPLHCAWCHNPESISVKPQKMYNTGKCIGCGLCIEACPKNACNLTSTGVVTNINLCNSCGICADVCPTLATEMSGRDMSIEEIMHEVEKDRTAYEESGGGITCSGGEPTLQSDFLLSLLTECGRQGLHRTVDTCGLVRTETLLAVSEQTEHFLYDLKCMDNDQHRRWTGAENTQILHNLQVLATTKKDITIRIPLIANINDSEENFDKSANFLASLSRKNLLVNLLPYHNIAEGKYKRLGKSFDSSMMKEPSTAAIQHGLDLFAAYGITATVGG